MPRRFKPTKLAIAERAPGGRITTSHRVFNLDEPEHSAKKPVAPSDLSARARKYFDTLVERMAEMDYASASYTEILTLTAETYEFVLTCREALKRNGLGERFSMSPAVRAKLKAEYQLANYLGMLGLTPTSKPKVIAPSAKRKVIETPRNAFTDLIGAAKRNGTGTSARH